ncbi:MAG: universal stress protein [Leptolyngbya sp.]|nr:universal stress protein [Candidatus Melainabacteria bacterium]
MNVLVAVSDPLFGDAILNFLLKHQWPHSVEFKVISVIEQNGTTPANSGDEFEFSKSLVDSVSDQLHAEFPAAVVSKVIYSGKPAPEILKTANEWQADMIIIGSHGKTGFERAILGSVSNEVVSNCRCSAIVVRRENSDILNIEFSENDIPEAMKSYV